MTAQEIVWEEPPPARSPNAQHSPAIRFAVALRTAPGKWAKWPHRYTQAASAYQMRHRIRNGVGAAWQPAQAFEAEVRSADGETQLYVRFVGESAA